MLYNESRDQAKTVPVVHKKTKFQVKFCQPSHSVHQNSLNISINSNWFPCNTTIKL